VYEAVWASSGDFVSAARRSQEARLRSPPSASLRQAARGARVGSTTREEFLKPHIAIALPEAGISSWNELREETLRALTTLHITAFATQAAWSRSKRSGTCSLT
jgi:hypothetical protein